MKITILLIGLILVLGFYIIYFLYKLFVITDKDLELFEDLKCPEGEGEDPLEGMVFDDYKRPGKR